MLGRDSMDPIFPKALKDIDGTHREHVRGCRDQIVGHLVIVALQRRGTSGDLALCEMSRQASSSNTSRTSPLTAWIDHPVHLTRSSSHFRFHVQLRPTRRGFIPGFASHRCFVAPANVVVAPKTS